MNIAVFIKKTTHHKNFGGMETMNKVLCEGLVERGHNVTVFAPKLDLNKLFTEENGVNYKFVECSFRSLAGLGYLDKNNWHNRSVEEFTKDPYDLVIGQSSAALGIISKKAVLEIPVISISHGSAVGEYKTLLRSLGGLKDYIKLIPNTLYFLFNFFTRQRSFILNSNKVIAVSKFVKKAIIEETFVPEERVEVIYNGIDAKLVDFSKHSRPMEEITATYVGLLHRSKGLEDLFRAVKELDSKKLLVDIVGDGPDRNFFENLVKKLDIKNQVKFYGRLPSHKEAISKIAEGSFFVLPSKRVEGFPMTLVEAMFAGLPIIGSKIGGIPEAIDNGINGFIYEPGDVEELKIAMDKLIENYELRSKMSEAARLKAEHEFSLNAMLNKYEKVFAKVVK